MPCFVRTVDVLGEHLSRYTKIDLNVHSKQSLVLPADIPTYYHCEKLGSTIIWM